MNILLLYPEFPDTYLSFKHALKFIQKKATIPPLGLLTVAAMLPSEWEKRLVDLNVRKLTDEDLAWADYAFIGAMVVQKESARQVISRCKQADVTVVAGGPLFTIEHEQFQSVDHFVLNEAEITLRPFLADLAQGCAKHIYTTTELADVQKTPVPLWELADLSRYGSMSIQFARGCPFHCDFCNVTALFGHRTRMKTTEQIIAELDKFSQLGWRDNIFFVDDNFIGNKGYLKSTLLPALIRWQKEKGPTPFNTQVSINLADDEDLMHMMVEAGFDTVFIGIETPDKNSLAECSKIQNKNRDLVEDVRHIQRVGLQVQGGFIVGFDSDMPSIFQRQIEFIQESGIVTVTVSMLQAPPGSKLYHRLKLENRLVGKMSWNHIDSITNIVPVMGIDTLRAGYRNIVRHIYSPEHYYQRIKTFLMGYKKPKIETPLNSTHIGALFRSFYHLGIAGKERIQYWKLLLWICFHRPYSFALAVRLAIYGHHFRKISELYILRESDITSKNFPEKCLLTLRTFYLSFIGKIS